jgi:hypothetical protein
MAIIHACGKPGGVWHQKVSASHLDSGQPSRNIVSRYFISRTGTIQYVSEQPPLFEHVFNVLVRRKLWEFRNDSP